MGDERLPARVETALYRIAQQALLNVARHAQADSVGVLLEHRDSSVVLIVEDDGTGFDVEQVMGSHVQEGNLGLYGMRERAALLGGTFTIESAPETGTSTFAEIPLQSEEHSDDKNPVVGG
jgi:signal transduction histidine kinase